jgi:reverse gyrase
MQSVKPNKRQFIMGTKTSFTPTVAGQPSESDEFFYQEAWSTVKLIKLRRRIAELEIERDRNRSERMQIQSDIQSYKAAYTVAARALQEEREPRLRLFKTLRDPASEFVISKLSSNFKIGLNDVATTLERLNVVSELARLGFLTLEHGFFTLSEKGKELIQSLSSVGENASNTSA